MKIITNETFPQERALYNLKDTLVSDCKFEGKEDGESALKESRNIEVERCLFSLRYPLWHVLDFKVRDSIFTKTCRAPLWYCSNGELLGVSIKGVKAIRECHSINIVNSNIDSEEVGWKSSDIKISNSKITSFYFLFDSHDIEIDNLDFKGKYSFQYCRNVVIKNSNLDTKDAFWHSKNVRVENSIIKGEYLGWFSEGLTLINCKIIGTQPLCYCKNLKLIDCELIHCDLSFEYSEVEASILGHVDSIKNPKSGRITLDSVGKIIKEHSIMETKASIYIRKKKSSH